LQGLALQPTTWSENQNIEDEGTQANDPKDINKFLLAVISSDLAWFDGKLGATDVFAKKDEVFGMASKRMAERCGRSGSFFLFAFCFETIFSPQIAYATEAPPLIALLAQGSFTIC